MYSWAKYDLTSLLFIQRYVHSAYLMHFILHFVAVCTPSCLNGGTCIDGIAGPMCNCPQGYTGINCANRKLHPKSHFFLPDFFILVFWRKLTRVVVCQNTRHKMPRQVRNFKLWDIVFLVLLQNVRTATNIIPLHYFSILIIPNGLQSSINSILI